MSKLILQQILSGRTEPVRTSEQERRPPKNPFMAASNYGQTPVEGYGVNQPLRHPMFVGYRDNKPIYAGSRLFVLY
jgi:hypothetical protein